MKNTNDQYWSQRWRENNTPWDMGTVSPPLSGFLQGLYNKKQHILIPGAGNAYEFDWLYTNGFENAFVLDIAREPLQNIARRLNGRGTANLLHADFFTHEGRYDLIVEQTFFCALPPGMRPEYAEKMYELLKPGGMLFGVFFDFPLTEQGPPFGGSKSEYLGYFEPYFRIHKLERCYNSIKPRAGKELFFTFVKA